jgi:hypothetical protein
MIFAAYEKLEVGKVYKDTFELHNRQKGDVYFQPFRVIRIANRQEYLDDLIKHQIEVEPANEHYFPFYYEISID